MCQVVAIGDMKKKIIARIPIAASRQGGGFFGYGAFPMPVIQAFQLFLISFLI